ncbi:MAG: hypothetical protein IJ637_01250 [Prevotella sp.]|nr:hypothetical protein [Prevotella sp.]
MEKKQYITPLIEEITVDTEGMLATSVLDVTQDILNVDPTQEVFNGEVLAPSISDYELTDMVLGL